MELVRRGATMAVLQLLQRGLQSPDAVCATPTGRQLHPDDLKTLLELLQSLTGDAGAGANAGVRQHVWLFAYKQASRDVFEDRSCLNAAPADVASVSSVASPADARRCLLHLLQNS